MLAQPEIIAEREVEVLLAGDERSRAAMPILCPEKRILKGEHSPNSLEALNGFVGREVSKPPWSVGIGGLWMSVVRPRRAPFLHHGIDRAPHGPTHGSTFLELIGPLGRRFLGVKAQTAPKDGPGTPTHGPTQSNQQIQA